MLKKRDALSHTNTGDEFIRKDQLEKPRLDPQECESNITQTLVKQAFRAAAWADCGHPEKALPLADQDWTAALPDAAGLFGAIMLSLGRFEEALPALERAVDGETRDPGAHCVNLGRALSLMGRPEEALPYLRQGLHLVTHGHALARRSLAEALLGLGQADEALALLPEDAKEGELLGARVVVLASAGRHEEAAAFLGEAMARLPEDTSLPLLAAELAEVRGRPGEAEAMLLRALDKDPENVGLWARLAQNGRMGDTGPAAREAADKALKLAEGGEPSVRALALSADAHVKANSGNSAESESAYREALQLVPGFLPALSGLGHLLMQNGKVDEAVACFQQVRAAAPLQGWSQLIHAREAPEDPAILEYIERVARQPGLEGPVRSGLLFTAAAAWDRKKYHDRAMRIAREANEASKRHLTYRPEDHRSRVDREMAHFSKAFMESRASWGHSSRAPVFVLGMPRSGTTLTEQILGSHSRVHGAGELGQIPQLIQRMVAWEQKLGSGVSYPECVADLTAKDLRGHGQRVLDELLALAPVGSEHVIDKLPHNFEHVGLIKLFFPNATIFHCKREARDIAVSNYITDYAAKFGGMGFAYDLSWIGEQLVDHDRLMAHWYRVFPGEIMEVFYEDLVENTEVWARRMIDHLGLDWEPGVLKFQDLERPVKTASLWQVRQPVYTTSKARWKRYEAHLTPLEEALGRIPEDPEPAPMPNLPAGQFDAAMSALRAGRSREAEAAFRAIVALNAGHAAAHHFLGAALVQRGRMREGREMMHRSLRLMPLHARWFANLAAVEEALGNVKAAQRLRERAGKLRNRTWSHASEQVGEGTAT